ncbi:transposase [Nocardia sp. NPDC046763]|uniref:transposase n=1 Tax=Nocardia sp. NPDC046763 TaxID=3155256 RepID=UPI0033DC1EAA
MTVIIGMDPHKRSVALAALRSPNLRRVHADPMLVALGLLADRRDELGRTRTETVDPAGKIRRRLAVEMLTELETFDRKIKAADKELRQMVADLGSTLIELNGIGPSSAARLLADTGDIHRFADRDRFASWNGTAPLDASSGAQQRHRLSRAGNQRINRVLHIMAIVQLRHPTPGRVYYDARRADGKTSKEALRALKRRLSNIVYARLLIDQRQRELAGPGGQSGTSTNSSVTGSNPNTSPSDKPQPGPIDQANANQVLT